LAWSNSSPYPTCRKQAYVKASLLFMLTFMAFSAQLPGLLSGQQQSDGTAQTTVPPQNRSSISSKNGRLSVHVEEQELQRVLEEISRQAALPIIVSDDMGKETVSISFHDLPLDEGLRAILKNADAFFFYGAREEQDRSPQHGQSSDDGGQRAQLKIVWVYPKGQGDGIEPVAPDRWASTKELQTMLDSSDPRVRGRAFEELIDRRREKAVETLHKALTDPDDQVRTRALYSATNSGVPLSPGELENMALQDSSPEIRFLALEALEQTPDALRAAQSALRDPNPAVQQKAREILGRLNPPVNPSNSGQLKQGQPRQ
jgi:HEAT repeat protein